MAGSPIDLTRLMESKFATFVRAVEVELAQGVAESANELQESIRDELQSGTSPSNPGEPPTDRSGALAESIQVMTGDGGLKATVGSNLEYATYLEYGTVNMAARPFMRPAFERTRTRISEIMARTMRSALSQASQGVKRER